jgi:CheY-like chemotaxis protein
MSEREIKRRDDDAPLLSASDVARFCQVDLKTVHNWVERGLVRHFRTPGRHLRFRRQDAVDFLRRYGYPVPAELRGDRATVILCLADPDVTGLAKKALAKRFEVVCVADPIDGLIAVGQLHPEALLIDLDAPGFDGPHAISRLRNLDATSHIVVLAVSTSEERRAVALSAGAHAATTLDETAELREVLERLIASE